MWQEEDGLERLHVDIQSPVGSCSGAYTICQYMLVFSKVSLLSTPRHACCVSLSIPGYAVSNSPLRDRLHLAATSLLTMTALCIHIMAVLVSPCGQVSPGAARCPLVAPLATYKSWSVSYHYIIIHITT